MTSVSNNTQLGSEQDTTSHHAANASGKRRPKEKKGFSWGILGGRTTGRDANKTNSPSDTDTESLKQGKGRKKWTMGMLNDQETDEVPGRTLSCLCFGDKLTEIT